VDGMEIIVPKRAPPPPAKTKTAGGQTAHEVSQELVSARAT
jgi:hypothetical protein